MVLLILRTFLFVFIATSLLTLTGLAYLWFGGKQLTDLPYLGGLVTACVLEVAGFVLFLAKKGTRYLPEIHENKTAADTHKFMAQFISNGSSVTIVSNRLAWLIDAPEVQEKIVSLAKSGASFEIITALPVAEQLVGMLAPVGVNFIVTGSRDMPEARFTLINGNRSGAERLAIAKGTHPEHEITVFDSNTGPQIIGMAKDIVRKSKAASNAA